MTMRIIHGDALETLDRLIDEGARFDAILTDPPYCSGGMTMSERKRATTFKYYDAPAAGNIDYDDAQDQVAFTFTLRSLFTRSKRLLNEAGYVFCFCDWRQIPAVSTAFQSAGLLWRGVISWDKGNARPNKGTFTPLCEFIVWGTRGAGKSDKFGRGLIKAAPPASAQRVHQSEKPIDLLVELLKILPDGARSVLDPFAGSGTVGCACERLGLDFTGVEINEHYANVAKQRLGVNNG
jgi:site-specific DNA-methyltransferase (adenine-specific)